MIKHIVLWRMNRSLDQRQKADVIAEIKKRVEALPPLVPEIKHIEVGENFNVKSFAFDFGLYSEFENESDLEAYQKNPYHHTVAEYINSMTCERAVVDYYI